VCVNVVFNVTVRGTVILKWTSTEGVKGDRVLLYNCGVQIVCCVW
jgi:hypothetical protein